MTLSPQIVPAQHDRRKSERGVRDLGRAVGALALCAAPLVVQGCAGLRSTLNTKWKTTLASQSMTLVSASGAGRLALELPTRVYTISDAGAADFYATDLPPGLLGSGGDLSGVSAVIVHVNQIVTPSAGDTPIALSATNALVQVLILHEGTAGLYAGGGFASPALGSGDARAACSVRQASATLVGATPGFHDALGACELSLSIGATRDDGMADAIQRAMNTVIAPMFEQASGRVPGVRTAEPR